MKIAMDYDETFTVDPILWTEFITRCQERGHSVTFVTYRDSRWGNEDINTDAESLRVAVIFTAGKQKQHCFSADVWIDDSPETVVSFDNLGKFYDGCLVNNDCS